MVGGFSQSNSLSKYWILKKMIALEILVLTWMSVGDLVKCTFMPKH